MKRRPKVVAISMKEVTKMTRMPKGHVTMEFDMKRQTKVLGQVLRYMLKNYKFSFLVVVISPRRRAGASPLAQPRKQKERQSRNNGNGEHVQHIQPHDREEQRIAHHSLQLHPPVAQPVVIVK